MPGLQGLIDWIICEGLSGRGIEQIMEGLAPRLVALGYPTSPRLAAQSIKRLA